MAADEDDEVSATMVIRTGGKATPPPLAHLRCIDTSVLGGGDGAQVMLESKSLTFGRSRENAVVLDVDGISRAHARVVPGDGVWGVEDLGSTNGVYINKSRISERAWLEAGDILSIGKVHYKYHVTARSGAAPGHDIDLGEADRTMVLDRGTAARPASPAPAPPRPAASPPEGSGSGKLWLVLVVAVLVVAGAALVLA